MAQKEILKRKPVDTKIFEEAREKVKFLKIFSYIGIPIGLILSINDFFSGNLLSSYLILAFVGILVLNLLQLAFFRKYDLGFIIVTLSFAALLVTLFLYGDGNMFVWIAPFGAATFFLMGSKRGFYLSMPLFIAMSAAILANNIGVIRLPYAPTFEKLSPDFVASIIVFFLFILVFQETIEKKQKNISESMEQLENEHRKNESIFSILETGLITANEEGIITFINKAGCELLRTTRGEVIGKLIRDVFRLERDEKALEEKENPLNRPPIKDIFRVKLDDNIDVKRLTGGSFPVGMNIIYTDQNPETRIAIVFFDLTAEKEISQFKDAFLSSMQHQISTPFSIIKWNIELSRESEESLAKTGLTKNDIVNETQMAIKRIMDIQSKILTSAKLEHGFFSQDTEDVDPREIAKEVIQHLYLNAKRIGVLVNLDYDDKVQKIRANKDFLAIVVDNVISNAIKYSRSNGVVDVQIKQDGENVVFKVIDNGVGIPKEDQKHIFDKFFRSENIIMKSYEGSGLGLYISKILVSRMGGEIWFDSVENKGTTFYVKIPNKGKVETLEKKTP